MGKSSNCIFMKKEGIAEAAISSSISAIAFVGLDNTVLYVNLAFLGIWGYDSSDDILGRKMSCFWRFKNEKDKFERKLRDKGGWIGEITAIGKGGREFPVQVSATMLTDEEKKTAYIMISFIDISERVNAEIGQQKLFKELQERVKELTCLCNILSLQHSPNLTLEEILKDIVCTIPPSMQWPDAAYARIVAGDLDVWSKPQSDVRIQSIRFPLKLKTEKGFLEVGYTRKDESEKVFLSEEKALLKAASQEITRLIEYKNIENELRINRECLLTADKMASIGVLSAEIMHEIGNPNNFIAINARVLSKAWDSILPVLDNFYQENGNFSVAGLSFSDARSEIPQLLNGILEGSQRIKNISSQLRDCIKKNANDKSVEFLINEAVKKAMEFTNEILMSSTEKLHVALEPTKNVFVKGDQQQIQQVIINLITNAAQALTSRKQKININSMLDTDNSKIKIVVKDEGCGINKKDLPKIMDLLYSTKKKNGNSGLGLSISNDIAIKHNGKLFFDSEPGIGTTVEFILPMIKVKEEL